MSASKEKFGLWLVGACGNVAATATLGLAALKRKLVRPEGLVTALPEFDRVALPDFGRFVVGGHEIRRTTLRATLDELHQRSQLFDPRLLARCVPDLRAAQRNVRPGTLLGVQPAVRRMIGAVSVPSDRSLAVAVRRLSRDIRSFCRRNSLARCIVVNLASTEPPFRVPRTQTTWPKLERALDKPGTIGLAPSCQYAIAAFQAGAAFIDFTPSCGITHPGVRDLADRLGAAYAGRDGKTGETLTKSALAPMFAQRNLRVLSWAGYNILGGRDGQVLDNRRHKQSKLASKDKIIGRICGSESQTLVAIDRVDSLHDRKVAWDFVHFRGFLDTTMSLQFTWQGSDSALAAPLVIDLARLAVHHLENGGAGCMTHLACFFKDPLGTDESDLFVQMDLLRARVLGRSKKRGRARA